MDQIGRPGSYSLRRPSQPRHLHLLPTGSSYVGSGGLGYTTPSITTSISSSSSPSGIPFGHLPSVSSPFPTTAHPYHRRGVSASMSSLVYTAPPTGLTANTTAIKHLHRLATQVLQHFFPLATPDHLEMWTYHLVRMASRAGDALKPDVREGDDMDVRHYVKIKRIPLPGHPLSPGQSSVQSGLRTGKHGERQHRRRRIHRSLPSKGFTHPTDHKQGQLNRTEGRRMKSSAPQGLDACLEPEYVMGVVCRKRLAHRGMVRTQIHPRILLLHFPLEFSRVEGEFISLQSLVDQETESLRVLVARIVALKPKPTLLLVGKDVSRIALDLLHEEGIAVARNVRRTVLEAVARCTKASIVESIERLAASDTVLGSCERFSVRVYPTCKFIGK